jgi:hypothetical protein
VEKFAPDEKKGPARAIVRALGHRGGANSSVDFAPCQGPFFSLSKLDFDGNFFHDLHGTHPASRPICSLRFTARYSDSIGITPGVREDCTGRGGGVASRRAGRILPGSRAQHRLSRQSEV